MKMPRKAVRGSIVGAVVAALLTGPFVAWQAAQGGESTRASALAPRGIVVVGDSISARYDDSVGSEDQAWWSFVGRHFDAPVTTFAQSGSGYLRPGLACTGDRFVDRPDVYAGGVAPSIVFVEGGRNDWAVCRGGRFVPSTDTEVRHAVDDYLDVLQTYLPRSTRIIVLGPPWGPLAPTTGLRITSVVRAAAAAHDVEFIDTTGTLTRAHVLDGVHPNRAGSRAIAVKVIRALT